MAWDNVDLDRIVDYKAEYTAVIEGYKITGNEMMGRCPFHHEKTGSFHVDFKTGKWNCFGCGESGNFVGFWAKYHGVDTKEAYKAILEKYGVSRERPKQDTKEKARQDLGSYSLEQYAQDKRLPEDFLRDKCRASTGKDRDGTTYLRISYAGQDGQEITYRKRYARKEFRWRYGSTGKIGLYGEWRLPEIQKAGWAILVEGESDTQSLWYMGLPAIGTPGASMFKTEMAEPLQGLKLYIHKEPDTGGDTFTAKVYRALKDTGFTGEVYRWRCSDLDVKDPSDLYLAHGQEEGGKLIRSLLAQAEPINLDAELTPEIIPGAPIRLRQPEGFIYSDKGVSSIDPKTGTPANFCRTPIILTQRLKSLETGDPFLQVYPVKVHIRRLQDPSISWEGYAPVNQEPDDPVRRGRRVEGPPFLVSGEEDRGVAASSIFGKEDADLLGIGQLLLGWAIVARRVRPLYLIGRQEAAFLLNIIQRRRGFGQHIHPLHPASFGIFALHRIAGASYTVSLGSSRPTGPGGLPE